MTRLMNIHFCAGLMLLVSGYVEAASIVSETSASDTIVIGATAGSVTLKVTGYKNLPAATNMPELTQLASFAITKNSTDGFIAVTYGAEHNPTNTMNTIHGTLTNDAGVEVDTSITVTDINNPKVEEIGGVPWGIIDNTSASNVTGYILLAKEMSLDAGVYPITLRAGLYYP